MLGTRSGHDLSGVESHAPTRQVPRDGDPLDKVVVVWGPGLSVEELNQSLIDLSREAAGGPDRVDRREFDAEGPDQLGGVPRARL